MLDLVSLESGYTYKRVCWEMESYVIVVCFPLMTRIVGLQWETYNLDHSMLFTLVIMELERHAFD